MPKAIAGMQSTRFELKSCPGGFVELKPMTYGQKMSRQGMSRLELNMGKAKGQDITGVMELANRKATYFEYKNCIVGHNLEKDDDGTPFNFANELDVDILDPRVGEEISTLINDMNNFENDEDDSKN